MVDTSSPVGPDTAVPVAIEKFLTHLQARKAARATVVAYRSDLTKISALMAEDPATLRVADLGVAALEAGFAAYAEGRAASTVTRAWSSWNTFCARLTQLGALPGNPMDAVGHAKAPRGAPHAFTDADMGALLGTLTGGQVPARYPWPARDLAIVATLAVTGLRRAEMIALAVADVEGQPGARVVAVRHGKGGRYRAVPIDPQLETALGAYLTQRWARFPTTGRPDPGDPFSAPPRAPLWVSDKGSALTSDQLAHIVARAYRAAGINARRPIGALVHALRHTFATTLIEHGASPVEVQQLLGHASLSTTQIYLATRPEHLRTAIAANPTYTHLRQHTHGQADKAAGPSPGCTAKPEPGLDQ